MRDLCCEREGERREETKGAGAAAAAPLKRALLPSHPILRCWILNVSRCSRDLVTRRQTSRFLSREGLSLREARDERRAREEGGTAIVRRLATPLLALRVIAVSGLHHHLLHHSSASASASHSDLHACRCLPQQQSHTLNRATARERPLFAWLFPLVRRSRDLRGERESGAHLAC